MYYLECQCRFRNVWNEIEGLPPFQDLLSAITWARSEWASRRSPVRVVDSYGRQMWPL